jgi:hypothetical protein
MNEHHRIPVSMELIIEIEAVEESAIHLNPRLTLSARRF